MVNGKLVGESDVPFRRRGRPAGKNRVPLSREERRARNAQYERERRNETAEAMSQLAEAVGCDPNISNADLLATVISRLERASRKKSDGIAKLEHINANLESQIATLQSRLGLDDEAFEKLDAESNILQSHSYDEGNDDENKNVAREIRNGRKRNNKRKVSERQSTEYIKPVKRIKTQSETWSDSTYQDDSGIELRSHTRSPPELCTQPIKTESEQSEPVLLETIEEHYHEECEANAELQAELYNEIYNPEARSCSGLSMSREDSMEVLTRSLIAVPSIVPPQEQPESHLTPTNWSESIGEQNVGSPPDFQTEDEINSISHQSQSIFVYLTDTEKDLINDWTGGEFLEANEFNNEMQANMQNYSSYGMFSGHA